MSNNLLEGGLEVWRMLNNEYDPLTYQSVEACLRHKDAICNADKRPKNIAELKSRLDQLEIIYHKYREAQGRELDPQIEKHDYLELLPSTIYALIQVTEDLEALDDQLLRKKILQIIHRESLFRETDKSRVINAIEGVTEPSNVQEQTTPMQCQDCYYGDYYDHN